MNYNDGKWHGWNGGARPVPANTRVHYYAMGNTQICVARADDLEWDAEICKIVCFCVIREPREFWLVGGAVYMYKPDFPEAVHVREVMENENGS